MAKNIGKNISKSLNSNNSQKIFDHAKKSATDAFKIIQKTVEATGDLIGNKIADKITSASKTSPKNNPETNEEEVLGEKYIWPGSRKKIIDDSRLKEDNF